MQNNFMESMTVLKRLIEIDPKNNIAKRELTEVTTQQVRKVKCIPLQLTRVNFVWKLLISDLIIHNSSCNSVI